MSDERDAFGYAPLPGLFEPASVQVAEGKGGDLRPLVVYFRDEPGATPVVTVGLTPAFADTLAEELVRWAQRAREKHWDPEDDGRDEIGIFDPDTDD